MTDDTRKILPGAATILTARKALSAVFAANSIESAEIDARLLVGEVVGLDHTGLTTRADATIAHDHAIQIEKYAARRLAHEPVARILGYKEFWSLPLRVTPAVLVPRPETETVVELALDYVVAGGLRQEKLRILDIGTGSGALLLALLSELENAIGVGVDVSTEALIVARENALANGVLERCVFVAGNFGEPFAGPFDIIVSNPPYIARTEIAGLPADVRDYDPHLALDGGHDGLAAYRAIVSGAARLLAPGGRLVMELGAGQAASVTALVEAANLLRRGLRDDLAGIPRAISVSRPA